MKPRGCNTNRLRLEENNRHQRCISCRREFSLLPMATPRRKEPAEWDLSGLAVVAEKDPPATAEYPARAEQDPTAGAVFPASAESDPTALVARPEASDWDPAEAAAELWWAGRRSWAESGEERSRRANTAETSGRLWLPVCRLLRGTLRKCGTDATGGTRRRRWRVSGARRPART
jgi:hypothetical protein